jgi:hypothetical protein
MRWVWDGCVDANECDERWTLLMRWCVCTNKQSGIRASACREREEGGRGGSHARVSAQRGWVCEKDTYPPHLHRFVGVVTGLGHEQHSASHTHDRKRERDRERDRKTEREMA